MAKLSQKLSLKTFILSQVLILAVSLLILAGLYYILNIQYQQPKRPFLSGPVTSLPKSLRLDLDQPDNDSLTFGSSIIVSGKTAPNLPVLIFTDSEDLVIKSNSTGAFSTVLNLNEGVSKITALVFDTTGASRSAQRNVYYAKEKI